MAKKKAGRTTKKAQSVADQLREFYLRNGYFRVPNPDPPEPEPSEEEEPKGRSHRGYEVRLTADDDRELKQIRSLLRRAGFKVGAPFVKSNQYRQPIYGKEQLERFLELVGGDKREQ